MIIMWYLKQKCTWNSQLELFLMYQEKNKALNVNFPVSQVMQYSLDLFYIFNSRVAL